VNLHSTDFLPPYVESQYERLIEDEASYPKTMAQTCKTVALILKEDSMNLVLVLLACLESIGVLLFLVVMAFGQRRFVASSTVANLVF
jgi:hypothetical protein